MRASALRDIRSSVTSLAEQASRPPANVGNQKAVIYWTIRGFGPEARAGFGIGTRVMQAIFLPAMAIAFATAPVADQNVGAGAHARVRQKFRTAVVTLSGIMLALTLLCQLRPEALIALFTNEPAVVEVGAEFLHVISWNFVATGIIFTCSGMFQALGNTVPALVASATRLVTLVLPAIWLAGQPWLELRHLWYVSVTTVAVQAAFRWWMLAREYGTETARGAAAAGHRGAERFRGRRAMNGRDAIDGGRDGRRPRPCGIFRALFGVRVRGRMSRFGSRAGR